MYTLNCKGQLLTIDQPIVMGIINTTPDSFYAGSRLNTVDQILTTAEKMITDGATILDVGGQSTRPGSIRVDADEELMRVIPAVEAIHKKFPSQIISIDTFYSKVAKEAVNAGAGIINDVSAGTIDSHLLKVVAALNVPYVLMHMKGDPQTMQESPAYENVTLEVFDDLNKKLKKMIELGIKDIIIDPGFGFGKTITHNFELLKELSFFNQLHKPIMVGLSRKATVYKTLNINPVEALNGTTVLNTIALLNGASILRVHDVKEAVETIKLVQHLKSKKEQ